MKGKVNSIEVNQKEKNTVFSHENTVKSREIFEEREKEGE